jgi:hypothetical protein
MEYLVLITRLGALIGTLVAPSLEVAARWKRVHELDPDVTVNIRTLGDEAVALDDETISKADAWLQAHGLPSG